MKKTFFRTRNILVLAMVALFAVAGLAYAAGAVPQTSSLAGTVVADSLVSPGATVSEGQVLVKVKTIAGTAPAARANCNGRVASVNVSPGSAISAGQVVATVQQ